LFVYFLLQNIIYVFAYLEVLYKCIMLNFRWLNGYDEFIKGTEVSKQQKDSVSSNETLKTNDAKEADTRQEMDPEIHTKANNDDNPVRENSTQMYSTLSIVDLRCMFMNDQWRFPASVGI